MHLSNCLAALGRPLPTTRCQLLSSLVWNLIRQLLHRLNVARVFAAQAARVWPDVSKSSRDAALAYHKLLQLSLTGKVSL